jgi:hypothetical protein
MNLHKITFIIALLTAGTSQAAIVELNSGDYSGWGGASSAAYGITFQANRDFNIWSIGIYGNPATNYYQVKIHSSTDGFQQGDLLANQYALSGDAPGSRNWNDIGIHYHFTKDEYYMISWVASSSTWGTLDFYKDSALPASNEYMTLIKSARGSRDADNFNSVSHPNFRINTIPIPASVWLFGSALGGLGWMRRRKAV